MSLKNFIDLHIHTSPDIRPRKLDDLEQAALAEKVGARAIVFKNHFSPTVARAKIAEKLHPGVQILGGVVLNEAVGGLNPAAVKHTLGIGGKIVWLPTLDAANHRSLCREAGGIRILDSDANLKDEVLEILDLVNTAEAILATGHLSKEEIFILAAAAAERKFPRLMINHPEHKVTNLSIQDQHDILALHEVYFERCHSQPVGHGSYRDNFERNWKSIQEIGYESTIIASDFGQIENDRWDTGMVEYMEFLHQHISDPAKLKTITHDNAAMLLGLPELTTATI